LFESPFKQANQKGKKERKQGVAMNSRRGNRKGLLEQGDGNNGKHGRLGEITR